MLLAQINDVAFKLFGLEIKWYAIIIVSGIILAVWLANRESRRLGYGEDDIIDFMLWALPLSIVGARLYYVIFDWEIYVNNPLQIFNLRSGGLAIYGGLIAGALVVYYFTQNRYYSFWKFLDIAAPSVIIGQAIGRWGNFTNHEAYGPKTTEAFLRGLHLPNFIVENMYIDGAFRHPTFLYESLWSLAGFAILLWLRSRKDLLLQGEVFFSYIMWYSFGRFFIEGLRTDSLYLFGEIRVSQLLSLILFAGALGMMIYRRKVVKPPYYNLRGVR
ncbi:prolipoprotein diacylglyceryl transferase [Vagococcus elongatus]|uniref:Phosphatidylglycerol--prolipoprotein diacylglyceryl transferase n=1 Tax=Vagococcus elongatus TaxID=180344 RepID=A0A430AX02_9ENTE|nr:prolipoprotein diacylglyceryl transferase [Vagococcus elongatus]RSU12601.1 prolipoprotein diacylglyceryl transferase [Vagococcus elongatus]